MNETIERENEKLTATARPWELDGCYIMRGTLTVTKALRFQDAALIVRAVNEYEALNAVAEDMKLILCTEFGSLINARKMAQGSGSIGYWAQVLNHYDALAAIRGGGK